MPPRPAAQRTTSRTGMRARWVAVARWVRGSNWSATILRKCAAGRRSTPWWPRSRTAIPCSRKLGSARREPDGARREVEPRVCGHHHAASKNGNNTRELGCLRNKVCAPGEGEGKCSFHVKHLIVVLEVEQFEDERGDQTGNHADDHGS
eukprot:scaffold6436_cov113-Isochrysis_galbana.AAC.10